MNETEKPELTVVEGGKADPPTGVAVQDENSETSYLISVEVPKHTLVDALKGPVEWKKLWTEMLPALFSDEAMKLKACALNGFKEVTTQEELAAAREKMLAIERPAPSFRIVKALPMGLKPRRDRRK